MNSNHIDLAEFALLQTDKITQAAQFLDEQLNHDLFTACLQLISNFKVTEHCNYHAEILYYPLGRFEQKKIIFTPTIWLPSTQNKIANNWVQHFFANAYFELDLFNTQSQAYEFQAKHFIEHHQNFFCIRFRYGWLEFLKDQKFNYSKTERMKADFKEQEQILLRESNVLNASGFEIDTINNCWYLKISEISKESVILLY